MKKVVVIGVSASGKTSFAKRLAEKIGIPVTHMDAVMWRPGWDYIGDEETVHKIKNTAENDEWLIEGYITHGIRKELFHQADTIIYLDYPSWLSAWRYIKRWYKHRKKPRPELPGSPEKFSFKFLKLVFTKGETIKVEKLLQAEPELQKKLMRLQSPKETELFIKGL